MNARRVRIGLAVSLALLLAAVWLFHASRPAGEAEGCPAGCSADASFRPNALRVASLNVLHGFPRFWRLGDRLELIAAEVRSLDADVVLLQEVAWTPAIGSAAARLARATGMNYVYARANGNRFAILFEEGEAILSRYALADATVVELPPRAGLFEHRIALAATVATPAGDLRVISTHLTHGDAEVNRLQAEALAAFVRSGAARGAVVIAGDFNATEDEPQMRALAAAWTDAYRRVHPDEAGFTCCSDDLAVAAEAFTKRIDYLFVAPGSTPRGVAVRDVRRAFDRPIPLPSGLLRPSDHAGLFAELVLPGD